MLGTVCRPQPILHLRLQSLQTHHHLQCPRILHHLQCRRILHRPQSPQTLPPGQYPTLFCNKHPYLCAQLRRLLKELDR
jgi:hypothetical protein